MAAANFQRMRKIAVTFGLCGRRRRNEALAVLLRWA